MSDFKKITDHPEYEKIVERLMSGTSSKEISQDLKLKYDQPDESHLRLSSSLLDDFKKNYLHKYDEMIQLASQEKLDKKIAKSLLNQSSYKERLDKYTEEKIDVNKKLNQLAHILEVRQEQIFDKIQENPGNTKLDYVLTKYFELNKGLLEAIDKIVNKAPDQRIEHVHSVKVIEEHSIVLQEAIRRVLTKMNPELVSIFMDELSKELKKARAVTDLYQSPIDRLESQKQIVNHLQLGTDKLFEEKTDAEFLDIENDLKDL
jgi:hypothetical protein